MLFLKGSHRYLCQLVKFVMTARVIELGSRASYTLRARSPPQHRSLGNVPVRSPIIEIPRQYPAYTPPLLKNTPPIPRVPRQFK
jgi:hypothetical protein